MRLAACSHLSILRVLYTVLGLVEIPQSSSSENLLNLSSSLPVWAFSKNLYSSRIYETKHKELSVLG